MGLETWYQAIPTGCGLLELASADAEIGESLHRVPSWFRQSSPQLAPDREGAVEDRLWDWCCQLAGRHPDLSSHNCYLDRRWDMLHYLLSATRRKERPSQADLTLDRAFDAGELIAEHVKGVQGVPVRYLTPAAVREVAEVVAPMDDQALAAHYRPQRMEAAGVYKFWADRADETVWRGIAQSFADFRIFFLISAAAGYEAIVVRD